ncbi:MAG: MBL fold metallo-hydrolase [Psychrosphaera sp.]|nr:MBL fold metallo-hydrolase [Psychrosphaera sp.]
MEFTFLGTSSGTPTKRRNVSGLALHGKNSKHWYMIDCGEATQHQLLRTKYSMITLKAIFITHIHGDHCYGLPGILASASMAGREAPLTIVAPQGVIDMVKAVQQTTQLWLDYELIYIAVEQQFQSLCFDDFTVEPVELSHRVPCFGYNFVDNNIERRVDQPKLKASGIKPGPLWGLLQKGKDVTTPAGQSLLAKDFLQAPRQPRAIFVAGDNDTPSLLNNATVKPDVVIHEATYTEDIAEKVGKGPQHSYARIVGEYAQSGTIKHLILTHFSARYGYDTRQSPSILDVKNEAKTYYKGNLFLANDFDRFELNKRGELFLNYSDL